jgi:peroxiredoxin
MSEAQLTQTEATEGRSTWRIRRGLEVILAGIEERNALSKEDVLELRRDLHILVERERMETPSSEIEKAGQVIDFMLRPTMEECLSLWFGKSDETDLQILKQFGAEVALASKGYYDHWALDVEYPHLLVALVILLDQFPRNMYRETAQMYASDAHCRALVKRSLRLSGRERLPPIERVFLCLALTHSETLDDQLLCMQEWDQVMTELALDDPLNVFHEIFHRHLAVIKRFGRFPHRNRLLGRANTPAEEDFLSDSSFRFDLPLTKGPDGSFIFAGAVKKRTVRLLDHEYETLLPEPGDAPEGKATFRYEGPEAVFAVSEEQLGKQGFVRIGDQIPDFTAETSLGAIRLYDFMGDDWCVLFSHPADFTPVCTTELGQAAKLKPEWTKRGVKVLGLSVDSVADHARWIADVNETQGAEVNFPIIADKDRQVSMLLGMLDATTFRHGPSLGQTMTVRCVFIISPSKRVELILSYPAGIGRNFEEILRVIDALQLSAKHHVATPVNWRPGDDTVVLPFISDEEAEKMFADLGGFRKVRSYLRFVRDPSLRRL